MNVKKDYANRASLLTPTEDYDNHWHSDLAMARKGIIAAIVIFLAMAALSVGSYAAQPAAPKHAQNVSVMSLVDDKGGE
jgi:hypothetical protein